MGEEYTTKRVEFRFALIFTLHVVVWLVVPRVYFNINDELKARRHERVTFLYYFFTSCAPVKDRDGESKEGESISKGEGYSIGLFLLAVFFYLVCFFF